MAIQKIFKSTLPSFRFAAASGLIAHFMNGKFTTDNKRLEAELMDEVGEIGRTKSSHPFIFIDEEEAELDTEALSPFELLKLQLKEEARQEVLREIKEQEGRAMNAAANVSSTSANFANSLNNTAKVTDSINGASTFEVAGTEDKALQQENSEPPQQQAATGLVTLNATGGLAARLANLTNKG
jgi:hypothetical protein